MLSDAKFDGADKDANSISNLGPESDVSIKVKLLRLSGEIKCPVEYLSDLGLVVISVQQSFTTSCSAAIKFTNIIVIQFHVSKGLSGLLLFVVYIRITSL